MATKQIRRLRDQLDVDAAAIADGKVPVYRSASDKHEYETPAGGGVSDHGALTGLADNDHPQYALAAAVATDAELAAAVSASEAGQVRDGDAAGGVLSGTYPNPGFAADMATQVELDAHVNDTADAHDASAVSFSPTGTIAATDVQAAIAEVASEAVADLAPAVILAPAASTRNVIQPTAGTVIAAIVRAHAAQSVDLTQWQLSDQTVLARVLQTGAFRIAPTGHGIVEIGSGTDLLGEIQLTSQFYPDSISGAPFEAFTPFASATEANAITPGFEYYGKQDWIVNIFQDTSPGGWREPWNVMTRRRVSDGEIIGEAFYTPVALQLRDYDPDTETYSRAVGFGTAHGFQMNGADIQNVFYINEDSAGTQRILRFAKSGGVYKWGIFGAVEVAQQAASSVGALWTALKAYGWLDSGSSAPTVYEAGGTDVAVADGGTGASTASAARTNLGLVIGTDVLAFAHEADTTSVHGITDTSTLYLAGGTDVALADGGTGASLADPNADRIMFWDDSAGAMTWLTPGTNLTITTTTIDATGGASSLDGLSDVAISSPTNGQSVIHDGSGFVNGQSGVMSLPYLRTGLYYGPTFYSGTIINQSLTQNRLLYLPFWASNAVTIDRLAIEVSILAALSTIRLGIYASTAAGVPTGAALVDGGTVDSTTTGVKTVTISQALSARTLYWLAVVAQGGAPSVKANADRNSLFFVGGSSNGDLASGYTCCYKDNGVSPTGALPTVVTPVNSNEAPRALARIV